MKIIVPSQRVVGEAVNDAATAHLKIMDALVQHLDQGDGWISTSGSTKTWHFGRLAAHLRLIPWDQEHILRCDIPVVEGVRDLSPELLVRLNEMNAHAYGWMLWWNPDGGTIVSSYAAPASRTNWWWTWFTFETIPIQVTVAESIADELASISGGAVANGAHPNKGVRPGVDGWVLAGRLGAREPIASLGHFMTTLDAILIRDAYKEVNRSIELEIRGNFFAFEFDEDGWATTRIASHWHPEYGWCWQHAQVVGFPDSSDSFVNGDDENATSDNRILREVARLNTETGLNPLSFLIQGGWIVADYLGLAKVSHLNGSAIEQVAIDARAGFGTSIGVALGLLSTIVDDIGDTTYVAASGDDHNLRVSSVLGMLQARTGPLGFQHRLPADRQITPVSGQAGDDETNWLIPKHHILANFGIFNPAGPTVGSLEVAIRDDVQHLFYVVRHPFSPECVFLTSASLDLGVHAFRDGLQNWFGNSQWSPIDWIHVYEEDLEEPIQQGLTDFASKLDPDILQRDLSIKTMSDDPWARVSNDDKGDLSLVHGTPSDWIMKISEDTNYANYQAFLRSAWEGSKLFSGSGDVMAAQSVSNLFQHSIQDRCLTDYELIRGSHGGLTEHLS
jgi:hypothetical protein